MKENLIQIDGKLADLIQIDDKLVDSRRYLSEIDNRVSDNEKDELRQFVNELEKSVSEAQELTANLLTKALNKIATTCQLEKSAEVVS